MDAATRNIAPTGFDKIFNRTMSLASKLGISVLNSRLLAVRGRKSGEWRTTTVNLMVREDGTRFLVAPRGNTQWVRNIRVAGGGELRLGRKVEPFTVTEVADEDKVPVLRVYLKRWGWEVGRFFEGVTKDSTDEELAAIAAGFPVFQIN